MTTLTRVAALAVVLIAAAGCGADRSEIRTRCDGPNMVYEAWVDEPGLGGKEFTHIDVVPNDPRCTGGTTAPTPASTPSGE